MINITRENKVKNIITMLIPLLLVILGYFSFISVNAVEQPILNHPKVSVPKSTDRANQKYSFVPKYIEGVTHAKLFGLNKDEWAYQSFNGASLYGAKSFYLKDVSTRRNNDKGRVGVLYSNVGTYNGEIIDLKITALDWKYEPNIPENHKEGTTRFNTDRISLASSNGTTRYEWKFLNQRTSQPVKLSGYITVSDMDASQGIRFDTTMMNKLNQIYVTSDTTGRLFYDVKDNRTVFYSDKSMTEPTKDNGMLTFMFNDTDNITFDWIGTVNNVNRDHYLNNSIKGIDSDIKNIILDSKTAPISRVDAFPSGSWFGYNALKPIKTETITPTKRVTDNNETNVLGNTLNSGTEEFTYHIYHQVPEERSKFYYSNYILEDTIHTNLSIVGTPQVYDDKNNNVTSKFDVSTVNNIVKVSAKPLTLTQSSFYNNTYKVNIKVKPNSSKVNIYNDATFTNSASATIEGDKKTSNTVTTQMRPTKDLSIKKELTTNKLSNINENIGYKLTAELPANMSSISLTDTASSSLIFDKDSFKVTIGGEDVKAQGTLSVSGNKLTWNLTNESIAKKHSGKQLVATYTGKVNQVNSSDVTNGNININNSATITDGKSTKTSNNVLVNIVKRNITGNVWKDIDDNNVWDSKDRILINKKLSLYKKEGNTWVKVTKNILGQSLENIVTDNTGKYDFTYLDKGTYRVGIHKNDVVHELVTKGTTTWASKFKTSLEGDYYYTDEIVNSNLVANQSNTGINAGIFEYGKLEYRKEVKNSNGNSIDGMEVKVGDILTYELTYRNTVVDSKVKGISIQDDVSKDLQVIPSTLKLNGTSLNSNLFNGNRLTYTQDTLLDNTNKKITFDVKVLNTATNSISNKATIRESRMDNKNTNTVTNILKAYPYIKKTADVTEAHEDDIITYTVEVGNLPKSGVWTEAILTDNFEDKNLEYLPDSLILNDKKITDSGNITNGKVSISLGNMRENEKNILKLKVKVLDHSEDTYDNTAKTKGSNSEEFRSTVKVKNNTPESNLTIKKEVFDSQGNNINGKPVKKNDIVTFRLTYSNTVKYAISKNTKITDNLDNNLILDKNSLKSSKEYTHTFTGNTLEIYLKENLKGNKEETIEFKAKISDDTIYEVENKAIIKGNGIKTNKDLTRESNKVVIYAIPLPEINKTVSTSKTTLGSIITYKIDLSNKENAGLWQNIVFTDDYNRDGEYVKLLEDTIKLDGKKVTTFTNKNNKLEFSVPDILSSTHREIEYDVEVIKVPDSREMNNYAIGVGHSNNDVFKTLEAMTVTKVNYRPANFKVNKKVYDENGKDINNKEVRTNQILTYEIDVINVEKFGKLDDLVVTDILPKSVKFVPHSLELNGKNLNNTYIEENTLTINQDVFWKEDKLNIKLDVKVLRDSEDVFENTVTVSGLDKSEMFRVNRNSNTVKNNVSPSPYLIKTSNEQKVNMNDEVTFNIVVGNEKNRGSWRELQLTDYLDTTKFTLKPDSTFITYNNESKLLKDTEVWEDKSTFNYYLDEILEDEEYSITYKVNVNSFHYMYSNTVSATSLNGDVSDSSVTLTNRNVPTEIEIDKKVLDSKGRDINTEKVNTNQILTYEFSLNNTENNTRTKNIKIEDLLDKNLEYVSDTLTLNGNKIENNLTIDKNNKMIISIDEIVNTDKNIVKFDVKVNNQMDGTFTNQAKVTGIDIATLNKIEDTTNKVTNYVESSPTIIKKSNVNKVILYDKVQYTIDVGNEKNAGLWKNVTINDYLIDTNQNLILDSLKLIKDDKEINLSKDKYILEENVLSVPVGDITENTKVTLSFETQIVNYAENYFNSSTAKGDNGETTESLVNITSELEPSNFNITKKVYEENTSKDINNSEVDTNSIITYELEVINENKNGEIVDILVEDLLTDSLEYQTGSLTINGNKVSDSIKNNKLVINHDSIKKDDKLIIRFNAKVLRTSKSYIDNIAFAEGKDRATDITYNRSSDKVSNVVYPQPDLIKLADKDSVDVLDEIEFTIKAFNHKNKGKWDKVTIHDILDTSKFQLIKDSTKVYFNDEEIDIKENDLWKENKLSYYTDSILENDSITIKYKVKVISFSTLYENTATAIGENGTPSPSTVELVNRHNPSNISINQNVFKEDIDIDNEVVNTNEEITYSLNVKNTNDKSILNNVIITDILHPNIEYVTDSITVNGKTDGFNHVYDSNEHTLEITLDELIKDTPAKVEFKSKVKPEMTYKFENVADVVGKDKATKKLVRDISNSVLNDVKPSPYIEKSVNISETYLNEYVTWELVVGNEKDSGVLLFPVLEDNLPEGLEYIPNSTFVNGELQEDSKIWKDNKLAIEFMHMLESTEHVITFDTIISDIPEGNEIINKGIFQGKDNEGTDKISESTANVKSHYRTGEISSRKVVMDSLGNDINNKNVSFKEELNYKITVKNTAENSKVFGLKVIDTLPFGIEEKDIKELYLNGNPLQNVKYIKDKENNTLSVEIDLGERLGVFEDNITYNIKSNSGDKNQSIKNTHVTKGKLFVDSEETSFESSNYVQNFILPEAEIVKSVNKDKVKSNEEFEYTLTIENLNGSNLLNTTIKDTLPKELKTDKDNITVIGLEKDNYSYTLVNNEFEMLVNTIDPNTTVTIKIKVISSDNKKGEEYFNRFTVTTEGKNPINLVSNEVKTVKDPIKVIIQKIDKKIPKKIRQQLAKTGSNLSNKYVLLGIGSISLISISSYIYYRKKQ